MITKNKKGKSFGGCIRYVLNEGCEVLAAEGVLAESAATIIRDFAIQRSGRPEIKQPVGHIAVSFSPEDSDRITNEFMLQLAHEYMDEMKIGRNTQYVIVRHHNTDHEHFHIVYNRIDNDLKLISVNNDYKRNVKVCKKLKDKYGLTYGTGKEKVKRQKLKGADKAKYEIHDQIAAILPKCNSYADLEKRLAQGGISIQYKYRKGAEELEENIQGISFKKGNYSFKGSEIDRKFSHANLKKVLSTNLNEARERMKDMIMPEVKTPQITIPNPANGPVDVPHQEPEPTPPANRNPIIGGIRLTDQQVGILRNDGYIFLENMKKKDGTGIFSAYVFTDLDMKRAFYSGTKPDEFVKYGKYEMRLMDKRRIEKGHLTRAKVRWHGSGNYAHPYLWKPEAVKREPSDIDIVPELCSGSEYHGSWSDPRISKAKHEQRRKEFEKRFTQNIPPPKKKGPKLR